MKDVCETLFTLDLMAEVMYEFLVPHIKELEAFLSEIELINDKEVKVLTGLLYEEIARKEIEELEKRTPFFNFLLARKEKALKERMLGLNLTEENEVEIDAYERGIYKIGMIELFSHLFEQEELIKIVSEFIDSCLRQENWTCIFKL